MADRLKVRNVQGAVRITLPVSVANDLDRLQKGLGVLAERLGHGQCCSGVDLSFLLEREAILGEDLKFTSPRLRRNAFGESSIEIEALAQPERAVSVTIPAKVSYDINALQDSLARIVGQLGCQACCSGFDISFLHEREFLLDQDLNLHAIAGR
jgi:hypothetical protein